MAINYRELLNEQDRLVKEFVSREQTVPTGDIESGRDRFYEEAVNPLIQRTPTNIALQQRFKSKLQRELVPKAARGKLNLNYERTKRLHDYYFNQAREAGASIADSVAFARDKAYQESQNRFIGEQNRLTRESQNRIEDVSDVYARKGVEAETADLPQYGVGEAMARVAGGLGGTLGGYYFYKMLTKPKEDVNVPKLSSGGGILREQSGFTPRTLDGRGESGMPFNIPIKRIRHNYPTSNQTQYQFGVEERV